MVRISGNEKYMGGYEGLFGSTGEIARPHTVNLNTVGYCLPARLHPFVLLVEPLFQRGEVFDDCAGIALALPS